MSANHLVTVRSTRAEIFAAYQRETRALDIAAEDATESSADRDRFKERAATFEAALKKISEHGYMSAKFSTPAELVRVMDWMIDTAKACLSGEPPPALDDEGVP